MSEYDSREDTIEHIRKVRVLFESVIHELEVRYFMHDTSKLENPEKAVFDEVTPRLKTLTYGSPEYKASLTDMGEALTHHYANNRHHPEHYKNGINDMSLIDIIEMLCDWKAATERHADGDIIKSLDINKKRFNISDQLQGILVNTVELFKGETNGQ